MRVRKDQDWIFGAYYLRRKSRDGPNQNRGGIEVAHANQQKGSAVLLGFTNFYQCFIHDFSHHGHPLFSLTGSAEWHWGNEQQEAFQTLKDAITSRPVLIFPDENHPFRVEADSSDFATGAILSQQSGEDEKWHLVAFFSKSLNVVAELRDTWQEDVGDYSSSWRVATFPGRGAP